MFDFTSSSEPERIITIKHECLQLVLEDYGYEYDKQLCNIAYMGFIVSINDYTQNQCSFVIIPHIRPIYHII